MIQLVIERIPAHSVILSNSPFFLAQVRYETSVRNITHGEVQHRLPETAAGQLLGMMHVLFQIYCFDHSACTD